MKLSKIFGLFIAAIAIMSISIMFVACPVTEEATTTTTIGDVYEITTKVANLDTAWGGSPSSPAFTVLYLTDDHVAALTSWGGDFVKKAPEGKFVYQSGAFGNASVFTLGDGVYQVKGTEAYTGLVAKISKTADNTADITLYVDMNKLVKTSLKALGENAGSDNEKVLTATDTLNLKGYKPYVLSFTKDNTLASYKGSGWGGGQLHAMTKSTLTGLPALDNEPVKKAVDFVIKKIPGAANASITLTVQGVDAYVGYKTTLDGSLFSWASGTAVEVMITADATSYNVDATAPSVPGWVVDQTPADLAPLLGAKLKIGAGEGWVGYKNDVNSTFKWSDKKE